MKTGYVIQKTRFSIGNTSVEIIMQDGFRRRGEDKSTLLHRHHTYEVHYIVKGEFVFDFGGKRMLAKEKSIVLIPPEAYHEVSSPDTQIRRVSFEVKLERLKNGASTFERFDALWKSVKDPMCFNRRIAELDSIGKLMGEIKSATQSSLINAYFLIAFVKLGKLLERNNPCAHRELQQSSMGTVPSDTDATVITLLGFINSNYHKQIALSDLAREVSLSERQVQRLFDAHLGGSFHKVLTEHRVRVAVNMIVGDKDKTSLEKIAVSCGFSSYVSFWSNFKRIVGKTPTQFRSENA